MRPWLVVGLILTAPGLAHAQAPAGPACPDRLAVQSAYSDVLAESEKRQQERVANLLVERMRLQQHVAALSTQTRTLAEQITALQAQLAARPAPTPRMPTDPEGRFTP